jgi:hypothetical protein
MKKKYVTLRNIFNFKEEQFKNYFEMFGLTTLILSELLKKNFLSSS